jgi:hypothetical protein
MRFSSAARHLVLVVSFALLAPGGSLASTLFQPAKSYPSGGQTAFAIAVGDLNGDGKPDLVVCDGSGQVGVLLGNGDGTFQPVVLINSGLSGPDSVAVADVNGDGKLDVVIAGGLWPCLPDGCFNRVSVLLGNGDGTFGVPKVYSAGYNVVGVAVADMNGDGKPDILVVNRFNSLDFSGDGSVGVLLGNGDGSFGAVQFYDSGRANAGTLAVGDLNGDGKLDVVVTHGDHSAGVLLGNGDGTLQQSKIYFLSNNLGYSIIADVNGDGKPDLLVTTCFDQFCITGAVGVLLGNGDGTFQTEQLYSSGHFDAISIALADVNGDGRLDVIVAHNCGGRDCNVSPVGVLLGNGDGSFQKAIRFYSGGKNAQSIVVADVNGDSKPDLLIANKCISSTDCTSGNVGVLLGTSGVLTTTKLSSLPSPSVYGQPVTLTAAVTSIGPSTPTGTVKFQNGALPLGSASLVGGVAVLTKTILPAGALSITALYDGDLESAKSISTPLSQLVEQASTTTTITSSANPSAAGGSVSFTAHVTSPTARATGAVTFSDGATTLGTVAVGATGNAKLTTSSLSAGSHRITATYGGTTNIAGSAASLTQIVD